MKVPFELLSFTSIFSLALCAPAPAPDRVVLEPRAATTSAVATITPGATGPSAAEISSAVAGCSNIELQGVTANDILDGVCKPFTLIFARGTLESGNLGGIVGPPLVAALQSRLGANNVAVQGVNNYPADIAGFFAGGSATGSADMASVSQFPNVFLLNLPLSPGSMSMSLFMLKKFFSNSIWSVWSNVITVSLSNKLRVSVPTRSSVSVAIAKGHKWHTTPRI